MGSVSLTHDGNGTASVNTNASSSTTFTLTSLSVSDLTVNLVVTACTGSLAAGSCTRSPTSVFLPSGASTTITASFTGGAAAGTGTITLAAKNTSGTTLASSSVSVTVTAAPTGPTVSTSPHRGDMRDVSQCVADCFEATLAYTTPAYISLDVPRSVTLLYRSGRAKPMGRLALDVSDGNTAVTSFHLQLTDPNGSYLTFSNGTTSLFFTRNTASGHPTRIVAEFDATSILTSAQLYTAYVTSYAGGTAGVTGSVAVRIIVVNDTDSPYGAGVDVVGLQRLSSNQTGGVVVTDGAGSASFFAGSCNPSYTCTYTSPGGDFSTLSTGGGVYKRTYPDGTVVTLNSSGQQTTVTDRFGNTSTVTYGVYYNGVVVPVAITDPTGQSISFWYRDENSTYGTWKPGSLGNIHTPAGDAPIGIDANNDAREWVELGGGTYRWRMKYLTQHLLDTAYDKASSSWKHSYRYGATLAYVDAPSVVIDGSSNSVRPRVQMRDAWAQLLDSAAAGKGTGIANALVVPTDSRASVTDVRGFSTYFTTNRFGAATKVDAPLTPAAFAEYDTLTGQLTRSVSPTGDVTRYTWNRDQLLIVNDSTLGRTVTAAYETSYSLPTHVYGSVQEQWLTYDHSKTGWPLMTVRSGSSTAPVANYLFDAYGRITTVTDPGGHTTSYGYAASGLRNQMSVTAPNGQTTTVGRNAWGIVQSSTAPNGAAWTSAIDVLNRPGWVAGQYGDTTKYQYDAWNHVAVLTDAKGQVYTSERNALEWVTRQTDPSGHADSSGYDVAGEVVYVRSRQGREVKLEYDALGRVTKRIGLAEADTISYGYDPNGRWASARVVSGATLVSTDTIVADSIGRTVQELTSRPGVGAWRVSSAFNATDPGRSSMAVVKTSVSPPTVESSATFPYDANMRLSGVQIPYGNSTFGYDYDGLPTTVTFSSGLVETTGYTSSHAPARRSYSVPAVDTALHRWYRTDSLSRLTARGGSDDHFQAFTYDAIGQLRTWAQKTQTTTPSCTDDNTYGYICNGTVATTDQIVTIYYDEVGNPSDLGAAVDPGNRLRTFNGFTMTYDLDGNMLARVGPGGVNDTYTWDDFGQLTSVTRAGVAQPTTFAYDGFGRRIRKTSAAGTIHYLWDRDQIAAEADGSGTTIQSYTYNPGMDQPRSVSAGGQIYFMSTGPGGDVNGLVRRSDNAVVAQYAYTPWGGLEADQQLVAGARVNSLRWHGLPYDAETGLYQVRARYYDPDTRRFISEDPLGLAGGINLYAFANGDPVNGSDPSGLGPCDIGVVYSPMGGTHTHHPRRVVHQARRGMTFRRPTAGVLIHGRWRIHCGKSHEGPILKDRRGIQGTVDRLAARQVSASLRIRHGSVAKMPRSSR
jgi:RHS repeat-associated protein